MSGLDFDNLDEIEDQIKFTLVGLAICPEFQRCLAYIELLHRNYPHVYLEPYIRPMLEFDWFEYVISAQRNFGRKFWYLEKPVIVCANKTFIGHDDDLVKFISERFHMKLIRDYNCLAKRGVVEIYEKYLELGRKFVYLTISINNNSIGHLIFMLYADLVPKTCYNFIKNCKNKFYGYAGAQIHRIMDRSWIQFGDYKMPNKSRSCENYKIPHNRRGVLSMCNNGRHKDNTTQFFVCLNPTPWMDYRYVAFGQLVQGELVLRQLEKIKTYYEYPTPDFLTISSCGEITLDDTINSKQIDTVGQHIDQRKAKRDHPSTENIIDFRDKTSDLLEMNYITGLYSHIDDNKSHLPMRNLPEYLLSTPSSSSSMSSITYYLKEPQEEGVDDDDVDNDDNVMDNYNYMYHMLDDFLLTLPLDLTRKGSTVTKDKSFVKEEEEEDEEEEEEQTHHDTTRMSRVTFNEDTQYLFDLDHTEEEGN